MPNTIAFNAMPADQRTSLFFAEFNAGVPPYSGTSRQLVIGHKTSSGTVPLGLLTPLGGTDPNILFGPGSTLADQAQFARRHDPVGEIYCLAIAEPGGGAADVRTVTFTGPATAGGQYVRYIAGEQVSIPVSAGDSATQVATRFAAAVNAGYVRFDRRMYFPVVAMSAAGVVTLTSRHVGTVGNQVRIESGLNGDEIDPAGLTTTVANPTPGTGDVDLATALAYVNTSPADWVTDAFAATTTRLDVVKSYLSNTGTGRWAPTVQKQGHFTTALSGSLSTLVTFGAARNDPHVSVFGANNFPHPLWCISAALNGVIARSKNLAASISEAVEISRPLRSLALEGIRPPKVDTDRFNDADRNSLYRNGIAGYTTDRDGTVRIERVVTTYQTNAVGAADTTFLDVETLAQSVYIGRYLRQRIESTYPRHALREDNPLGLQGVVTAEGALNTGRHAYRELCDGGICEKPELVNRFMKCERSADPNRLNFFLPADVTNQLRVFAANITIYNEFDQNRQAA